MNKWEHKRYWWREQYLLWRWEHRLTTKELQLTEKWRFLQVWRIVQREERKERLNDGENVDEEDIGDEGVEESVKEG